MTTFTVAKSSPNKSEVKNASLAMKSRQQVLTEVNKRRTLLQDNSWIKKQPEEESAEENYGRVVLTQYKSQDSLHRNVDEKDQKKALLSHYGSDTTLNRISDRNNTDKANKLPIVDSRPNNGKGFFVPGNTDNASPVKKKRQSWMPPPVPGPKLATDHTEHPKRQSWAQPNTAAAVVTNDKKQVPSASDKPGGPKMTVHSSRPITPPKPNNNAANDQLRTRQICPAKPNESDASKNTTTEKTGRSQDLDNLIQVKAAGDKSEKGNLDDLIKVNPTPNGHNKGNLDNLIKVNPTSNGHNKGSQALDNLIQVNAVNNNSQKGDLDELIKGKPVPNGCNERTLDDHIKVNPASNGYKKGGRDLDDFIDVNNTASQNKRSQKLDDLIVIKSSTVDQNKKWISEQDSESANTPDKLVDMNHLYQVKRGSSKFPHDAYEDSFHGKTIKTVYSTSDRSIIEKEMCTFCRKPLGTDTKMILDALQISCHATCFRCEVCKGPLESLKAGDSIWIYKNTVHCEPCYSEVKASWIY